MSETNDMDLVREYVAGSDAAFAELVQRHINLVYSVALRFSENSADVEDIAQAVFIILAKKAASLRADSVLAGWLYETTRLSAKQWLRSRARRQHHEQEASMEPIPESSSTDALWQQLRPLLEDAMSRLSQKERTLLALRFFENRTGAESAAMLGIGEWAARKRAARALEKLRRYFANHSVSSTTAILERTISANSLQVAPVALAKAVAAVAVAKGAACSASTLTLVKGALKIMAWTKAQTAMMGVGILLVAGTTGGVIARNSYLHTEPSYNGRRLSEWLPDVVDTHAYPPPEKRKLAVEAIRKMGTRTIPFLLAALGDEKYTNRYGLRDHRDLHGDLDTLYSQATWAFDALGPMGKSAIPELQRIVNKNPGYVPLALAGVGSNAAPELLTDLTNENFWVRDNTAIGIANAILAGKLDPAWFSPAFPIALSNLNYTDANSLYQVNTRSRAAWLLAALKQSPEVTVPALIAGLQDSSVSDASDCAFALGQFRKDAKVAIPDLTRAANSTNFPLNLMAKQALENINAR